jgi:hypothetical protein
MIYAATLYTGNMMVILGILRKDWRLVIGDL